jgi:hypothetical protein
MVRLIGELAGVEKRAQQIADVYIMIKTPLNREVIFGGVLKSVRIRYTIQ